MDSKEKKIKRDMESLMNFDITTKNNCIITCNDF